MTFTSVSLFLTGSHLLLLLVNYSNTADIHTQMHYINLLFQLISHFNATIKPLKSFESVTWPPYMFQLVKTWYIMVPLTFCFELNTMCQILQYKSLEITNYHFSLFRRYLEHLHRLPEGSRQHCPHVFGSAANSLPRIKTPRNESSSFNSRQFRNCPQSSAKFKSNSSATGSTCNYKLKNYNHVVYFKGRTGRRRGTAL